MNPEIGTMGDDSTAPLALTICASMPKGDTSWQNLVLSVLLRVIALPKAMVNVICVVEQGLILAWRC